MTYLHKPGHLPAADWYIVEKRVKVVVLATGEREAEELLDTELSQNHFVLDAQTLEKRKARSEDMQLIDLTVDL